MELKTFRKWMFAVSVTLLILFTLTGTFVMVMQSSFGRKITLSMLTKEVESSGWQIKIGQSKGTLPDQFHLHDISIQSPRGDIITIQTLLTKISLIHLLKKEICFTEFQAEQIHWTQGTKTLPPTQTAYPLKGLSFSLSFPELELKDIFLPNNEEIDLAGKIHVGRYNRWAFISLTAQSRSTRDAYANLLLHIERNKQTRIHLNLNTPSFNLLYPQSPILGHGNFHLHANGPLDAFTDIIFHNQTNQSIHGTIRSSLTIDELYLTPSSFVNGLGKGHWSIFSKIERLPSGDVQFNRLSIKNPSTSIHGSISVSSQAQIKKTNLYCSVNNLNLSGLPIDGPFYAHWKMANPDSSILTLSSPHLKWEHLSADKIKAVLHAQKENENWSGHLDLGAQLFGQNWEGHSDLLWQNSLTLDKINLQSTIGSLEGNLQISPEFLFIGSLRAQAANLHDFDFPLYGSIDTTLRLKTEGTVQSAEIDAKGANLFYGDAQAEEIFLYADLNGPIHDLTGTAYAEIQHAYWNKLSIDTASVETSSNDHNWPIVFHVDGDWKGAFDLIAHASWHPDSTSTLDLEDLSGFLFDHPLTLTAPSQLSLAPNTLRLSDLNLAIGDAHLAATINHENEKTDAKLTLDHFPLDFLSINPLSLSVIGFVDLEAQLQENGSDIAGSLHAQIIDAEIAAENDPNPLTGQGAIQAKLKNHQLDLDANVEIREAPLLHLTANLPFEMKCWPFQAHLTTQQNASASLSLNGRIEELLDFFDLGAHRLEGQCECNLNLSNDLKNPHVTGTCKLIDGRYENYYSGLELQNINIDLVGEGSTLRLLTFTAQDAKEGNLQLKGEMQTQADALEKLPFHLNGDFSHLTIAEIEWMRTEANGTIEVTGNLNSTHVNIQAAVVESHLTIPEKIHHELPNLQVKYINAPKPLAAELAHQPRPASYPIFLDCHVYAPNGVFVSGRGLSSEWKGNLNLGGTYTDIEARGRLDLLTGEFLFSGHALKLKEGSLTFSGHPHEMPLLNLSAQMDLPNLIILAHLNGPLNRPQLAFQSIPALPMGSIISQLLFGQDLSEVNAIQAVQIVNSIASFSSGSPNVLENTRRTLGVDRLRIVATPLGNDGGQTVALQVGKYVTRGILVSVTQGAEGTSTNLMVEVDLTSGFVFEAESQQQPEQGKFTLKWNLNY